MTSNYIQRIHIKNYRSLVDTAVDLTPLTVLVGKNGSGKSNLIDAIYFVSDALRIGINGAITRRRAALGKLSDPISIELQLALGETTARYTVGLSDDQPLLGRRLDVERLQVAEQVIIERVGGQWLHYPDGLQPAISDNLLLPLISTLPTVAPVYQFLTNMRVYNPIPGTIRSRQPAAPTRLLADEASNLAAVLQRLQTDPSWSDALNNTLEVVLPHVEHVAVEQLHGGEPVIVVFNKNKVNLPLEHESDGTIRLLALLVALYQQPTPALIGLEEPELYIHPQILPALCEVMLETAMRSQVLVATHSPDLIARFHVDDLRIVERTPGGTKVGPIEAGQRRVIEEELFQASDILRIDGDLSREPSREL